MNAVEICFLRRENLHYRQEIPDLRDLDVMSDLYLGVDALGGRPTPDRLRVTIQFDDVAYNAAQDQREQTADETDVIVGFYREMGRTIRYQQEVPDPNVMKVIPSPYIGKEAIERHVGSGQVPQKLRLILHFH